MDSEATEYCWRRITTVIYPQITRRADTVPMTPKYKTFKAAVKFYEAACKSMERGPGGGPAGRTQAERVKTVWAQAKNAMIAAFDDMSLPERQRYASRHANWEEYLQGRN
jgi:hypothetical protein